MPRPRLVPLRRTWNLAAAPALHRALALLANVTELDMDTNFIAGPLPAEWGCLKELIEIDFSDNLLTGTVPLEWGLMSK